MKSKIAMQPVESSQLTEVGHDPSTNTLAVRFKQGGGLYHYANFTADDFKALLGKDKKPGEEHSIGSHFIRNVKKNVGKYPFTRINEGNDDTTSRRL